MKRAAAGILRRKDGAVFMQQRREGQSFAGCWEFPGGKINPGESAEEAVCRELREETGIAARRFSRFVRRRHPHSAGGEIMLDFFAVSEYEGAPRGSEGQNCRWADIGALPSPLLPANIPVCKWLRLPPLCAISAAEIFGAEEILRRLAARLQDGRIKLLLLRDKTLPPQTRRDFALRAAELCRKHGALCLINDDEKLAARADGLHLSAEKLRQCRARPDFPWVGASCHTTAEIARAADLDLDFALLSPVCQTKTHPGAPPLGWQKFSETAKTASIPIYALGGMREEDAATAQTNHGCGAALMRLAWE